MERVITHLEEKLADLELQIATREQGIKARKQYGVTLTEQIREVKKQVKIIASTGRSTKFIDRAKSELVEISTQNTNILSHLKRDITESRHEAYCLSKAIEALK